MTTNGERIAAARAAGAWAFNNNYEDLGQVAEFYPAYSAVVSEILDAGRYPYNDDFKGRIPGIEGPCEDTAIYLLQHTRRVRAHQAKLAAYRAAGYRDLDPAEVTREPKRFASIIDHSYEGHGDSGVREYGNARLMLYGNNTEVLHDETRRTPMIALPKGARTHGHLIRGHVLVKD